MGIINKPGSTVFAGHPDSVRLYEQLAENQYLQGPNKRRPSNRDEK
jgi:hypothetical protein